MAQSSKHSLRMVEFMNKLLFIFMELVVEGGLRSTLTIFLNLIITNLLFSTVTARLDWMLEGNSMFIIASSSDRSIPVKLLLENMSSLLSILSQYSYLFTLRK